jgi:hypothetical protein
MNQSPLHRFVIELIDRKTGDSLGRESIANPDFEPAIRSAEFRAWCARISNGITFAGDDFGAPKILPSWHPSLGQPNIDGIEIEVAEGSRFHTPIEIFQRNASAFATRLVTEEKLEAGTSYFYRVAAFEATGADSPAPSASVIAFDDTPEPNADFPAPAVDTGTAAHDLTPVSHDAELAQPEDHTVYLPERVLRQTEAMAASAEGREIGGFLVGHLCRIDGKAATVVSDQIPASHTDRAEMSLTLTPKTWQSLNMTLQLRGQGELVLGWHHLHPASTWCKNCVEKSTSEDDLRSRIDNCAYQKVFFSDADKQTSRAAFAVPYQVGLLVVDTSLDGVQFGMFGWRNGILSRRSFEVVSDTKDLLPSPQPGMMDRINDPDYEPFPENMQKSCG